MQAACLFLLCTLAPAGAESTAERPPAQFGPETARYRAFVYEVNTLKRTPPRRPADIRAAAERLSAFETDVLIRGFILHSAFRLAGRDCLAGLPPPPAQPAPAALASCLKETMEEMAGLDTALGTLGRQTMSMVHSRNKAAREDRPAPEPKSLHGTPPDAPPGGPATGRLGLFTQIISAARRIAAGGPVRAPSVDDGLARCLRIARLNSRQCLAAAHFGDEEIFCAARHAFTETGKCWGRYVDVFNNLPPP